MRSADTSATPRVPNSTFNTTTALGQGFRASAPEAESKIARSRKGRWSLARTEEVIWFAPVWIPAYCLALTVTQPERKRGKTQLRAVELTNLYDALGGQCLGRATGDWEQVEMLDRQSLRPGLRATKVHAAVRKAGRP